MYGIERKSIILSEIESNGVVDVTSLAEKFDTSRETIRRDLKELETDGLLKRTHGGAVSVNNRPEAHDFPIPQRLVHHYEEKIALCREVAKTINDGDIIFIDNSSTTVSLINYIDESKNVVIITNSIQILVEATKKDYHNLQIILLGGEFEPRNFSVHGFITLTNSKDISPTKSIMSCRSVEQNGRIMDGSINEVQVKQSMIENSKEIFLLVDHTKFKTDGAVFLTSSGRINHLYTTSLSNEEDFKFCFPNTTEINVVKMVS